MKKVLVAALAVALAAVMAVPAGALENEFGGYFRVRAFTQSDLSGQEDSIDNYEDLQRVDTRTRLSYTAKFSDDFKFVNNFEMDSVWGDADTYGDIGADNVSVEVKNSYIDYNLGNYNVKLGAQTGVIARGFVFWDDFSGAKITGQFGNVEVPFYWMKINEGGLGDDANDADKDAYAISPVFNSGNIKINPFLVYVAQSDQEVQEAATDYEKFYGSESDYDDALEAAKDEDGVSLQDQELGTLDGGAYAWTKKTVTEQELYEDFKAYDIGINLDVALDGANAWFTGIYQGGSVDVNKENYDLSSYLVAFGGDATLGDISVHGQMFHASGDDDEDDRDLDAFSDILSQSGDEEDQDFKGQSYYWAEIMGYGMFDPQYGSNGSPSDKISNITAFNLGASMSPMEKLTVGADLWYAMLAEDDANGEDELGTEIDLSASYEVMENLNLDVVAAYLFAGDATGGGKEDPMELGAQLSVSF